MIDIINVVVRIIIVIIILSTMIRILVGIVIADLTFFTTLNPKP